MFKTESEIKTYLRYCSKGTKITLKVNGLYSGSENKVRIPGCYLNHNSKTLKIVPKYRHHPIVYMFKEINSISGGWR